MDDVKLYIEICIGLILMILILFYLNHHSNKQKIDDDFSTSNQLMSSSLHSSSLHIPSSSINYNSLDPHYSNYNSQLKWSSLFRTNELRQRQHGYIPNNQQQQGYVMGDGYNYGNNYQQPSNDVAISLPRPFQPETLGTSTKGNVADEFPMNEHGHQGNIVIKSDVTNVNMNVNNNEKVNKGLSTFPVFQKQVKEVDVNVKKVRQLNLQPDNKANVQLQQQQQQENENVHNNNSQKSFTDSMVIKLSMKDINLLHVVGGGAFGQVWKGMWKGTPVAVKVLSALNQYQVPESVTNAFNDEVQMLARLRHPNICLFIGACMDPPTRAIVTEFVTRGSLWEALRTPTFPVNIQQKLFWPWWAIRKVLDGTCRGLVYLHSNVPPIIHRDMKSANLLLDDSFNVKICDFGLARLRDLTTVMTANVGTAQWTAPEVLAGHQYGESADMYSLGVITWELITGKCPFENLSSHMEIAVAVVQRKQRPPIPVGCPESVRGFIEGCWKDIPARRYTASQALELLDNMEVDD